MKKYIFNQAGVRLLDVVEAEPTCGDYCDRCGECLHCYAEDSCSGDYYGQHYWVEYKDEADERT